MPKTALVSLEPLHLIPVEAMPNCRRQEIATRKETRHQALGDAVSTFFIGTTSAACAFGYLFGAVFMLMRGWYGISAVALLLYFILGFFACHMGDRLARTIQERRRLAIGKTLRLEAAAEQALAEAASHLNIEVASWNECVRLASEADLESLADTLIIMRGRISAQLLGYRTRLGRYYIAIASATPS